MLAERPSRRTVVTLLVVAALSLLLNLAFGAFGLVRTDGAGRRGAAGTVSLPSPSGEGDVSVEEAIAARRSRREYGDGALALGELGQLLWAAQGVTERATGYRAAPSAGALYPLELYAVVGTPGVEGLEPGVYRYRPRDHELGLLTPGDVQSELQAVALDQDPVGEAAVDLVVSAVDERTARNYGRRGTRRYVPMEAGHAAENVSLQAESLGLSTVSVGAFDDGGVRTVVGVPADERPLYVLPVGERV